MVAAVPLRVPLAELEVGDSRFLGFCTAVKDKDEALAFQKSLQTQYPDSSHVPVAWRLAGGSDEGFDEDEEPLNSTGPSILKEVSPGLAVAAVRYFGSKLLGVTCGRLPQCYQRLAQQTIHRYSQKEPMELDIPKPSSNIYGVGAGDCEVILNVVEDPNNHMLGDLFTELSFDGFRGSKGEVLPRLQNMQADLSDDIIPVYRYPGNYSGQEWETFSWSPISLEVKKSVEEALRPLVDQSMNHCVTNYYRDGTDFIAHHSDKDLDLNRKGVIVSVSLGDERVLELRRRTEPKDTIRVILPHGSMLVIGPRTNQLYSHSILPKEGSTKPRLSLTLRQVVTFLDVKSGRLFGQGVLTKSRRSLKRRLLLEHAVWFGAFCALSSWLVSSKKPANQSATIVGLFGAGSFGMHYWRNSWYHKEEEKDARHFFSRNSVSGNTYTE